MEEIQQVFREYKYCAMIFQRKEEWLPAGEIKACFTEEVTIEMGLTWGMNKIWIWKVEEMRKRTQCVFNKYLLAFEPFMTFRHSTASYQHLLWSILWGKQKYWFLFSLAVEVIEEVSTGCNIWFLPPHTQVAQRREHRKRETPSYSFTGVLWEQLSLPCLGIWPI